MKNEWIFREILFQVFEKKNFFFTQKGLASECFTSLSNVNHALKPLQSMNAIEKKAMGFRVIDAKKILLYWASKRNLQRDIVFETRVDESVEEIEKSLPSGVIFTAYSAFKFSFKSVPAEYSEVLVYAPAEKIEERFPKEKGAANLIVLKKDEHLKKFKIAPLGQIYTDLWNLNKWYAQDFLKALEKKIDGLLE